MTVAAAAAAVAVLAAITVPPRPLVLAAAPDGTVAGIFHVHTSRSDGSASPEQVADAAARAGLRFVVFTDHGDGTRRPEPPVYRSGVLCLDGVEVSTDDGHYVGLDVPASPYPLGGEGRDVAEDVRRLGGIGIVAHPDSPKPELAWRDWRVAFDGVETLNLDTTWRRLVAEIRGGGRSFGRRAGGAGRLAEALLDYPFRPAATIARMADGESAVQDRVDAEWRTRRVVALAGADAHANLELRGDPSDNRRSVPVPGYEPTFRAMSLRVSPERPLIGDAVADAAVLLRAIRNGHLYTVVDGLAAPAAFEFTASNALGMVHEGDELSVGGPVTLRVRSNAPAGFRTIVRARAGVIADRRGEAEIALQRPPDPDEYRVEIVDGRRPAVIWLRSNPIYIRGLVPIEAAAAHPAAVVSTSLIDTLPQAAWQVEHDPTSIAELDRTTVDTGTELRFRWGLSGGARINQYVGIAVAVPGGLSGSDRLTFGVRAEHPMRISVQLRGVTGSGEVRWRRSVYVPAFDQAVTVYFDDMRPAPGTASRGGVDPALVRSVLFVIDTTNTRPGASGRLWLRNIAVQR